MNNKLNKSLKLNKKLLLKSFTRTHIGSMKRISHEHYHLNNNHKKLILQKLSSISFDNHKSQKSNDGRSDWNNAGTW